MSYKKLSFKEQARWTGYGIAGGFVPAIVSTAYPKLALACSLLSVFVGVLIGRELFGFTSTEEIEI